MTVLYLRARMVGVAQLVELRLVMPAVVGSSPIVHPIQFTDLIDFFSDRSRGQSRCSGARIAARSRGHRL
jgi:hypothetical protein